jgi:hypothetical protein
MNIEPVRGPVAKTQYQTQRNIIGMNVGASHFYSNKLKRIHLSFHVPKDREYSAENALNYEK